MSNALIVLAWLVGLALIFNGWPSFITIHKHYHNKDGGKKDA